jgi:uncharacterized iron-regulated membrane protein
MTRLRIWPFVRRWLIWFHRWLGVATCLLCLMWFATGLVMLYVPFPSWSDAERVAALPALATGAVRVLPDDALSRSGITTMPDTFRLEMYAGEPVYRIVADEARASVSAITGAMIGPVNAEDARRHLVSVYPGSTPQLDADVDYDQWTPTRRFDPHRPLYRFNMGDIDGTVVYVSSRTGEIVQNATYRERAWNWVGAVPHWIYFAPIRRDQELWRQAVMWLSGPLVIGAVAGVWLGIIRLRPSRARPLPIIPGTAPATRASRSVSPYRGWMKWHHIAGLVGGVFLCTWIFSGWLSVNPFHVFARTTPTPGQIIAFTGWTPSCRLGTTAAALANAGDASEISFAWSDGKGTMLSRTAGSSTLREASTGAPLALGDPDLTAAAARMYPHNAVVSSHRLTEPTFYWYSHNDKRPLPVIEVQFDDAAATAIYVDPANAGIAGLTDRSARANRWLFDLLHDWDLPILLRHRPVRDALIWLLSFAGLIISVSGVVIAWRTLKRTAG